MTLREDLFDWLSAQALWQQTLARRLTERTELEEDGYLQGLLLVKGAFGALAEGEDEPAVEELRPQDLPTESTGPAPKLLTFGRLQGVGAITNLHELTFSGSLTIVYGANAAGKSTYVRAMKRVCRTVDRDAEVRGNVFSAPSGGSEPTARVSWLSNDEVEAEEIDLKNPPDLGLEAISVFDALCAELYIDAQNGISYVPPGLLLLARLAALQDRMRADIQREISSLKTRAFSFPEFDAESAVRAFLEGLSATSEIEEAERLAALEESEAARLVELQATLASSAAHSVRADALAARQDAEQAHELAAKLREIRSRTEAEAIHRFREAAVKKAETEEAVELAAQAFSGLPLVGFGSDAWRRMWQGAREFGESGPTTGFPPSVGEPCPLCMQDLSDEAAHRFQTFEQHVSSAVRKEAENAKAAFQAAVLELGESDIQEIAGSAFLARLRAIDEPAAAEVQTFLEELRSRIREVRFDPQLETLPGITVDPADALGTWAKGREEHASTLLSAEDPERESQLRREWTELDARQRLSTRLDEVRTRIEELRLVAALEAARTGLATNRITTKQKEFTEGTLAGELEEQLKLELQSLNCGHLPVALNPETSVGETRVGLRLAGAYGAPRVSDIASEGEQRALALSFFFAEVASGAGDGGIVVDDPVSSLDEERRSYIADRLVQEADRRQVIVFTHDLPFMLELVERAEEREVASSMQGVWRHGGEVGRVDDQPPFKAMNFKGRVAALTETVQEWDSQPDPTSFDEAWRRVCDFYAQMRTTWERAVEERLFRGVVRRFQRQVKTLRLKDVSVSEEQVKTIEGGMARCSEFVHDEPPAASSPIPPRSDLAADLEELRTFEKETRRA